MNSVDPNVPLCPKNARTGIFPGKNGGSGQPKTPTPDFGPSDFGLVRCLKSTLKGSIIGFSGPKMSFLVLISGDFYDFLQKNLRFRPRS